jgi:chromate reductase, NAD(P)H dehydrogenase (quinone)
MNILTICGSLRANSYNASLARALSELAPEGMTVAEAGTIGTLPHYNADVQTQAFPQEAEVLGERIRSADGVIIVSPEYNYSMPGVLKNAIDWLSRLPDQPFKQKPLALQSASTGMLGGARAQYHLRQVMVFVEARVFNRPEVIVASAKDKFDETTGKLIDAATRDMVSKQLAAFKQFAGATR